MCEAVVPDGVVVPGMNGSNPLKVTLTSIVLRVVFRVTVACPVPGEPVAGTSFAPVRLAVKTIVSAKLAGTGRISAAAIGSKQDRIEMAGNDSFMFASLAEELG